MTASLSLRSIKVATIAASLVLAACSGSGDTSEPSDAMPSASMSDGMGDMNDGDESFAFGAPADAAEADRTVEVEALDALSFDPAVLAVEVGETITFVVTNSGAAAHEFVIGDMKMQDEHEEEMQAMAAGMMMGDEANAVVLAAGETKSITWHFTEAGQVQFACHQPGHYGGGMIGTFDVS